MHLLSARFPLPHLRELTGLQDINFNDISNAWWGKFSTSQMRVLISNYCNLTSVSCMFCFPIKVLGNFPLVSFHNLSVQMHMNKMKFERNKSLKYYHMICIGKTNPRGLLCFAKSSHCWMLAYLNPFNVEMFYGWSSSIHIKWIMLFKHGSYHLGKGLEF